MRQRILARSTNRRNEVFLLSVESQYLVGSAAPCGSNCSFSRPGRRMSCAVLLARSRACARIQPPPLPALLAHVFNARRAIRVFPSRRYHHPSRSFHDPRSGRLESTPTYNLVMCCCYKRSRASVWPILSNGACAAGCDAHWACASLSISLPCCSPLAETIRWLVTPQHLLSGL
jgi:hypothetical protein